MKTKILALVGATAVVSTSLLGVQNADAGRIKSAPVAAAASGNISASSVPWHVLVNDHSHYKGSLFLWKGAGCTGRGIERKPGQSVKSTTWRYGVVYGDNTRGTDVWIDYYSTHSGKHLGTKKAQFGQCFGVASSTKSYLVTWTKDPFPRV